MLELCKLKTWSIKKTSEAEGKGSIPDENFYDGQTAAYANVLNIIRHELYEISLVKEP